MDNIYKILESLDKVNEGKHDDASYNVRADGPRSSCCDAPLLNYNDGIGICSDCKDHAGPHDDEELDEGQYDGKSREELLKMKADAEASMKNMQSSGDGPQQKFYDETQMMMAQQHLDFINDALKKVGESVEEAEITPIDHSDDEGGASVEDIESAITRRIMNHPKFGALIREIDIIDLNDAIEDVARFHEGGDLGSSDVSAMVNDVLKQLKKEGALSEQDVNEAVSLDQARKYFFDKHDFADENIQGEYNKMASKMSPKDAMTLKKELEELYPEALKEEDIEENAFVKARLDAIKAGKKEFNVDGKTYKVTGDTSDEEKMTEDEDSMPASPDEGGMAGDQIEFIKYAAQEIKDHIENGGDFPEWFQNKMSDVYGKMKDLHGYMEGDKRNDAEQEEAEEVDETTVAGSVATSADGKGIYKNASVYESMNAQVENMISESMSVNVSSSTDGEPSVSVSATGDDALALAQLLQLAKVGAPQGQPCEACGEMHEGSCMNEENEANSANNTHTYDMHYLLNAISGGLNGQKKQVNPNNPGDNPLAMGGIGKDTLNLGESEESHIEKLYKKYNLGK